MANSHFDNNHVPTLTAISSSDGSTIINVKADATTHVLEVSDGATGSDLGPTNAKFDENHVPVLMAVSSADGVTPVPVYVDTSGNLLIKST